MNRSTNRLNFSMAEFSFLFTFIAEAPKIGIGGSTLVVIAIPLSST